MNNFAGASMAMLHDWMAALFGPRVNGHVLGAMTWADLGLSGAVVILVLSANAVAALIVRRKRRSAATTGKLSHHTVGALGGPLYLLIWTCGGYFALAPLLTPLQSPGRAGVLLDVLDTLFNLGVFAVAFAEENSVGDMGDTQVATFTVAAPQVTKVMFTGTDGIHNVVADTGVAYHSTWQFMPGVGPSADPLVFTSGDDALLTPTFVVQDVPLGKPVYFEGIQINSDGTTKQEYSGQLMVTSLGSYSVVLPARSADPISATAGIVDLKIDWKISIGNMNSWVDAGTTDDTAYVTWKQTLVANPFETSLKIGCTALEGAGVDDLTPENAADLLFAPFEAGVSGTPLMNTSGPPKPLTYWANWSTASQSTAGLLATGDGKCEAWQKFLGNVFASEGIKSDMVLVAPPAAPPPQPNVPPPQPLMFVKSWTFGKSSMSVTVGGVTYNHLLQGWQVKTPAAGAAHFEDVFNGPIVDGTFNGSIPVQGKTAFPQTIFTNHSVVSIPGVSNLYFDPSYGKTYTSVLDFQNQSLSGIALSDPGGTTVVVRAINPGELVTYLTSKSFAYQGN